MTTIAWDGKAIACDSKCTDDNGLDWSPTTKVFSGSDFLIGVAGNPGAFQVWWRKVKHLTAAELVEGEHLDVCSAPLEETDLLLWCATGCYRARSPGVFVLCVRSYHAIGSGRDFALAAMRLGRTAAEAVALAMEFDSHTGGEIKQYEPPDAEDP